MDYQHVLRHGQLGYPYIGGDGAENVSCWESIMKEIETNWEKLADESLVHVKHCPYCGHAMQGEK